MSVSIRLAESADLSRCLELLNMLVGTSDNDHGLFDAGTFSELISKARVAWLLLRRTVTSWMASISFNLALRYNGEYCQLEELVVDPKARGKNVGGLLLEETIGLAKARGCKEFGLYLLESTKHNEPFYAKYGFLNVGLEMRQTL